MEFVTNRERSLQKKFIKNCLALSIRPTKRQASKLRNGRGSLFNGQVPSVPYVPEEESI